MKSNHEDEILISIPFTPDNVNKKDIKENGKLLADADIKKVKENNQQNPGEVGRFTKTGAEVGYPIINQDNRFYAVYKGKQGKELGKGSAGRVKLVQDLDTGKWAVIKIAKLKLDSSKTEAEQDTGKLEKELAEWTKNEVEILHRNGQSVTSYYLRKNKFGEVQAEFVMELASGATLTKENNSESSTIDFMDMGVNVLDEIKKLHDKGILHRDIKGANIIYDTVNKKATLVDFGYSVFADPLNYKTKKMVGTTGYFSPELIKAGVDKVDFEYNEKTEVFSLGVTLAELYGLRLEKSGFGFSVTGIYESKDFEKNFKDPETQKAVKEFIEKMTENDPIKRISLTEAQATLRIIRNEYFKKHLNGTQVRRLGYFNVSDYLKSSELMQQKMIAALKNVEIVHLVSDGSIAPYSLAKVKGDLENRGIVVLSEALLNKDNKSEILDDHTKKLEEKHNYIYQPFYIHSGKKISNSHSSVTDVVIDAKFYKKDLYYQYIMKLKADADLMRVENRHIEKIKNVLEDHMKSLKNISPSDPKISIIQKHLDIFKSDNKLNYKQLFSQLKLLEKELTNKNPNPLIHLGMFKSSTIKTVSQLRKDTKNEISRDTNFKIKR